MPKKTLEISKGAYYPTLSAFFNYNTRYSDQFSNPFTGELIPFIDQLWLSDGISFGAQLNIPVFNGWATSNNVKRQKIAVERSKLAFEQVKLDLEADVQRAYADVSSFGKAYEAASKTLEARKIAYQYAKDSYEAGVLNAIDYQQATARVDSATADAVRAKYEYIFRVKVLEFYYGIGFE